VKRAISFYQEKYGQTDSIKRIILVGGEAKLPGLVGFLAEEIGLETQVGNPWQKVSDTKKLASQPFDPILFSEAVGLALKQIAS
jgi:type IV pilus assembly protein PilM